MSDEITHCKGLTLTTTILGNEYEFLIETGASRSIIYLPPNQHANLLPWMHGTLRSVTQHEIPIVGVLKAQIPLEKSLLEVDLLVTATPIQPLLGMDFLRTHKVILNLENNTISTPQIQPVKLQEELITINDKVKVQISTIRAMQDITIEPQQLHHIKGELDEKIATDQICLIEPSPYTGGALRTMRSLAKTSNEPLMIAIANFDMEPITIRKGALIAIGEILHNSQINQLSQVKSYEEFKIQQPEIVIGPQLTTRQTEQVQDFMNTNHEVFAVNPQAPTTSKTIPVKIPTGTSSPIKLPPHRANPNKAQEINKKVEIMAKDGIIEKTQSPWSAPVVLVQKKDGTTRFCVDYRKLNAITTKDSFPVPRVDDTLDALGNAEAQIFTTMDLASGYWQLKVANEDKEKTAFVTQNGTYQFNVLPFGLTGAPGAFCRAMNTTLEGLIWKCCLDFIRRRHSGMVKKL